MRRIFRNCAVLLAVVGCKTKAPDPPDPAAWAKLGPDEKCRQAFPRAADCTDELIAAQMSSLGGSGLGDEMLNKMKDEPTSDRDAVRVHKVQCAGSKHYADAVYACWKTEGCAAFAKCVADKDH